MSGLLPSVEELRRIILKQTRMTGDQLDEELKPYQQMKFLQGHEALQYYQLAQKLNVDIAVSYASREFDGPTDEEIQDVDGYTLLNRVTPEHKLKQFNVRGMLLRLFGEKETDKGTPKRSLMLIDESGERLITFYGDIVADVNQLTSGQLLKVDGITLYQPEGTSDYFTSCWDNAGETRPIEFGEYGTHDQMFYETPVATVKEAVEKISYQGSTDYYTFRGYFVETEEGDPIPVCPTCLEEGRVKVLRGKPGQYRHCKTCRRMVPCAEYTPVNYMFFDAGEGDITVKLSGFSKIKPEDVHLIDPPFIWPHYFLIGKINEDRNLFWANHLIRLPDPMVEEISTQIEEVIVEEPTDDRSLRDGILEPTKEEFEEAKTEVVDESKPPTLEEIEQVFEELLDFTNKQGIDCDQEAYWPEDSNEREEVLAMMRDKYNETKRIWKEPDPVILQMVLSNQAGFGKEGPLVIYQIRPILINLFQHGLAKVERGKIIPT